MTCANYAPPLGLSWENITVSSDGRAVSRGIAIGVGTPYQIISLRPSINDDNAWFFNAADCINDKNASCIGEKGGVYNSSRSSTFVQTSEQAWNGTEQAQDQGSFIYFNDIIQFGANGSADGFPLLLNQPGQGTQSGLGIGPKSTFLDAAVKSGSAPSRNWGLWAGSRSVINPADGALWIGGYDSNRVAGEFTAFRSYDNCITCVQVTNITYVTTSASNSLFSNSSQTLTVALQPFDRPLNVPPDIFENFRRISGGTVGTDTGTTALLTFPNSAELGNLSITLSNGFQTVIPSQEFFFPPRLFNKDGVYDIANNTYLVSTIANATVEAPYVFNWGVPFFTMNYMVMDYDNETFYLAPARQGPYGISNGPLVEPLCEGVATISIDPVGAPGTTSSSSPTPPPPPPSNSSDTNVGAIAGGVVGGVLGLALIILLVWFIRRSQKRENMLRAERDAAVASNMEQAQKQERMSQFTATSPTEVSEAPGPENNKSINHWLYDQNQGQDPQQSPATLNAPFEMPAHGVNYKH